VLRVVGWSDQLRIAIAMQERGVAAPIIALLQCGTVGARLVRDSCSASDREAGSTQHVISP